MSTETLARPTVEVPAEIPHHRGLKPTPIDLERSKLPLPILPYESALITSEHHHAHPRDDELLKTDGGLAVRIARLQTVEGLGGIASRSLSGRIPKKYGDHPRYHYFFHGPPLPQTEQEQFEYAVWATSGYVPELALDVSGNKPKIVRMNPDQIARLHNGELRVSGEDILRNFLKNYVFKQELSHIKDSKIDEFVSTKDWERKRFLGRWLLAQATEVATESISDEFRMAHKLGLILPWVTSKVSNVVQMSIVSKKREQGIIEQYQHLLTPGALQTGVDALELKAA